MYDACFVYNSGMNRTFQKDGSTFVAWGPKNAEPYYIPGNQSHKSPWVALQDDESPYPAVFIMLTYFMFSMISYHAILYIATSPITFGIFLIIMALVWCMMVSFHMGWAMLTAIPMLNHNYGASWDGDTFPFVNRAYLAICTFVLLLLGSVFAAFIAIALVLQFILSRTEKRLKE